MNRTLMVASVCFVLGAFVGFAVQCSLGPKDDPNSVDVVVATHYLQEGVRLQEGDVRVVKFPKPLAPHGAYTQRGQVVGQFTTYPIAKGELLQTNIVVANLAHYEQCLAKYEAAQREREKIRPCPGITMANGDCRIVGCRPCHRRTLQALSGSLQWSSLSPGPYLASFSYRRPQHVQRLGLYLVHALDGWS